ncbi:hypothetical protein TSTA_079630 [Talaromyces stipitatus ATCC 10500]|uniref:Mitochondrial pyruvate carrier n=1 Tax=Talaromyces stipitatus (strain ATCC 10500 / CBS 375.48 / QM 6759 / NRRL 1006) TaxID=441959 RepID=B8LWX5_TALSN|nr:uncharacterized protein TSTA_079630 [Talaromyces stipitatus ATCC 10500]EED24608.1 hypothetical protein TSTA_079630 [Talaromyces stipitatus ATCC 10500]
MYAAIKAINTKIRSNKALDYFCSTHFWGPASNFGIPIAAVADIQKDPEMTNDGRLHAHLGLVDEIFPCSEAQELFVIRNAHSQSWCSVDPGDAIRKLLVLALWHGPGKFQTQDRRDRQ